MLRSILFRERGGLRITQLPSLREWGMTFAPFQPVMRCVWTEAPSKDEKTSFYDVTVEEYAKQPLTNLTLMYMLEAGKDAWFDENKVLESARFCREELPKRLARRLLDLQLLPYIVVTNPHIERVYRAYYHAFNVLRATPVPRNLSDNESFSALLRRLVDEHSPLLDSLANGLREIRQKPLVGEHLRLDPFLEAMLRSRISRRVLAEHHINLANGRPGYIGVVCTDLSLGDSVDFAAGRCRQVCQETFGTAPDIFVGGDVGLRVPYIPAHIDYMLYELLKNAARAVTERHLRNSIKTGGSVAIPHHAQDRVPPIHVKICGGRDDVTIRVSDQGGGIPAEHLSNVWEFGWTDIDKSMQYSDSPGGDGGLGPGEGLGLDSGVMGHAFGGVGNALAAEPGGGGSFRMAGLGFGLPLSRLYARYFGGDLRLVSMPGYGVDAFLYLKGLVAEGREWRENTEDESSSSSMESVLLGPDTMVAGAERTSSSLI